ncbi:MAG: hypothetical protein WKF37_01695 [Bryobacteraceae bacterium]
MDRLLSLEAVGSKRKQQSKYRADAVILILGVPVFKRADVGGGVVALEEIGEAHLKRTEINFRAGSLPARARGLNRLGFLQEVISEKGADSREAAYFGFMTSSPEENLSEAKQAYGKTTGPTLPYTAIDGCNTLTKTRSTLTHFLFPSELDWGTSDKLIRTAREKVETSPSQWRENSWKAASGPPLTFLHAMLTAIRATEAKSGLPYVYSEKHYRLNVDRAQESGLTRLRGETLSVDTGKKTHFTIWLEAGADLPKRIEFQPKPYLRLTFEAV